MCDQHIGHVDRQFNRTLSLAAYYVSAGDQCHPVLEYSNWLTLYPTAGTGETLQENNSSGGEAA